MRIKVIQGEFSICKLDSLANVDMNGDFLFVGKTDEELSVVCEADRVPESGVIAIDEGWSCFRIEGQLDFSLVGILAKVSDALARAGVGIFAVSTYNTDYILVKSHDFDHALEALAGVGYEVLSI